jgi:hypothetical protein
MSFFRGLTNHQQDMLVREGVQQVDDLIWIIFCIKNSDMWLERLVRNDSRFHQQVYDLEYELLSRIRGLKDMFFHGFGTLKQSMPIGQIVYADILRFQEVINTSAALRIIEQVGHCILSISYHHHVPLFHSIMSCRRIRTARRTHD